MLITVRIPTVKVKMSIVSSTLTSKILPNKKLKISRVNPPERPIITRPMAIPEDKSTATEASPEMLNLSLTLVIIKALNIEMT